MIFEDQARHLHDRVTRGEAISEKELNQLSEWYAIQDQRESEKLGLAAGRVDNLIIQKQIDDLLMELDKIILKIRDTSSENAILKNEIFSLRSQLA